MADIGIYSGTFDPIHVGHLAFADEACRTAKLNRVVFMPEPNPRDKINVSNIHVRNTQIIDALKETNHEIYYSKDDQFTISRSLSEIVNFYPDDTLYFLVGSDIVSGLRTWPHVDRLLDHHQLIIGMRDSENKGEIEDTLRAIGANYMIVTTPHSHVSSRQIRNSR